MRLRQILQEVRYSKKIMALPNNCVTVFGSARLEDDNLYCKKAFELSKKLASNGFTIITGGGEGIMKAANKGAFEINQNLSVGLNIILPHEQGMNKYVTKAMTFSTMSLRKMALIEKSKYFVIFPGGFGTLDELFEILTLVQTKLKDAKIYIYDTKFYGHLIEFFKTSLLVNHTISNQNLEIFMLSDDIDEICGDIINHYNFS